MTIHTRPRPPAGALPSGLYVPSDWGSIWDPAKQAAAAGGKSTVAVIGHSLTRGFSADLDATGWVAKLRAALQSRYGDGGSGWRGVIDSQLVIGSSMDNWPNRAVISAGWSYYTGAGGTDGPGATVVMSDNTAGRTWKFPGLRGRRFKAYHLGAAGNGQYRVIIDNGAPSAIVDTNGAQAPAASPVFNAAAGVHDLTVSTQGGAGVVLQGASAENDSGIVVNNYGKSSGKVSDFVGDNTFGWSADWNGGEHYPADLLIINLDAGDIFAGTTVDAYLNNMRTILDHVRGAGSRHGGVELMFVMSHIGKLDDVNRLYPEYCHRTRALAETYGAAFVNVWSAGRNSYDHWADLGNWGIDSHTDGAVGNSNIHLSTAGQAAMFDAVRQVPGLI